MSSWTHETRCSASPDEVLRLLTNTPAIVRWSPVPFELPDFDRQRLGFGDRLRVRGALAGCGVEFLVEVTEARDGRLSLIARGPIDISVDYLAEPEPGGIDSPEDVESSRSRLRASVAVAGRGIRGRVLAGAADALLAAGALRTFMSRLARELEPAGVA